MKKTIYAFLLLSLLCSAQRINTGKHRVNAGGGPPPIFVQARAQNVTNVTSNSSVTTGNTIYVGVGWTSGVNTSVTDTFGTVFTNVSSYVIPSGNNLKMWVGTSAGTGVTTYTAHWSSGPTFNQTGFMEFTGSRKTVSGTPVTAYFPTSGPHVANVTTTVPALIVAVVEANHNTVSWSTFAPATLAAQVASNDGMAIGYYYASVPGTNNIGFNCASQCDTAGLLNTAFVP